MATKTINVTMSEETHRQLSEQKGEDRTWQEALERGCEVLADE